jgi:CSLREA domain-containing protein
MISEIHTQPRPGHLSTFRLATIRTPILSAMLAVSVLLSLPQAWATAAATTTMLTVTSAGSDVTSVSAGTVVTLTATVVSGSTPVTPGQVRFCDATAAHCEDSALLATAQLTAAGTATYKFRPGGGSHTYQAVFAGTNSYAKSTSTDATLTVTITGRYPTATTIASSGLSGNYSLTATVVGTASRALSPTGEVSFLDTTNGNTSLGTAALGLATPGENFATASTPSVGASPMSVTVGDFNGDGIMDLATANLLANSVTVLLGNGDGTFILKASPGVGANPWGIAIGDFNGDGILDLVTANSALDTPGTPGTVTILLGNGDGTFTTKSTPGVGNGPYSVAVGDFNGDGIPDLAVANTGDNTVTILLGNGDGTFTTKSTPGVGDFPYSVAVGDFNGDGIQDLAVANALGNSNGSTVTVMLGKGDGTFAIKSTPDAGSEPCFVAVGDFNRDGIPDLAVANCAFGMTVLLGIGDGTFTAGPRPPVNNAVSVAVGDFNGDGISDFAVANDATVSVLQGNGDGTFTLQATPNIGMGSGATWIAVGDFNGDGTPDLVTADFNNDSALVLLNQITDTDTVTLNNVSVSGIETHQVLASYPGDTNYRSSTSSTVPLLAAQIATTLKLSSSASSIVAGNTITLTATLSPYVEEPFTTDGETVTFFDGTTSIGTGTLSAGVATLNISSLRSGTHNLTVTYTGDGNFSSSTSGAVTVTISPIVTTLQLYSNPNPSILGAPVTLSAILSPDFVGGSNTDGETVTFYNGNAVLGTGTLSDYGLGATNVGMATLNVASLPDGIDKLTASYPGDGIYSAATSNTVPQAVNVPFPPIPNFVVTVTTDTTTGVASNCTGTHSPYCSLRDALAAAFAAGSGNITFDPTIFATPQTIAGGQSIPPHTTITGPTTGSGPTLTNLVTVSGGGTVFTVNPGVTNAAISGLTITGGFSGYEGGGILNSGVLAVSNSTISGNSASNYGGYYGGNSGGGIENLGTLTLINSTVTGNSVSTGGDLEGAFATGGGIDNQGTLTITNSSVVGNSVSGYLSGGISNVYVSGGGINNYVTLTMTNSVITGNSASSSDQGADPESYAQVSGGGVANIATMTITNNIVSGNINNGSEDDCDGASCGTNGVAGNVIGVAPLLPPLGNYGGPTQTMPPLPGSPAICTGLIADIPKGLTTDQRGVPRTTTYNGTPCVDSGPVQTNYSLSFSTEPPSTIPATTDFTAAVQVTESGNIFPVSGISILIALAAGNNGALNVSSLSTNLSGIAADSQFQISAPGNDKIVATLPLTASGIAPAAAASTTSTGINVTQSSGVQVTVGVSPSGLTFMVDGVSYTATITLVWPLGSQHTLSTTSPQGSAGTQYTFASWSDGGAITHTVTASTSTIDYTATFNTAYLLTTSANPSQGGTVAPPSGYFPANSSVLLTATANPGYTFTSWTGNVASTSSPSTGIAMSAPETVTANFTKVPIYTVNTNVDDSTGVAANCSGSSSTCSLRDALAAAAAATSGADIEFDPTVFAASQPATARTIVLGSALTLNVPNNTRIFGPTTGSGTTFTPLVTISGKNLTYASIFSAGNNTVLSGLVIADDPNASAISSGGPLMVIDCTISGNTGASGGGISNGGMLTVMGTTISGNSASQGGGGILNEGSLTVIDSTISGNSASGPPVPLFTASGGGIYNLLGTATIIDSTISGNSNTGIVAYGGMDQNVPPQFVTVVNSTISGNSGGGVNVEQGIDLNSNNPIPVTLTVNDSILSGNTKNGPEDDCDAYGTTCPASGQNGNFVGSGALLAPLANYGGPTQTQPPLPSSSAICAGVIADIPSQTTTDQRGFPRTTTYGSNPPCVDSGAVQTNYALSFSTEPPASVPPSVNFTAAVQLSESGNPFPVSGVSIPVALESGDAGSLNVSSLSTTSSGIAGSGTLQVSAEGTGDTLVATLPLTTTPPPAPLTSAIDIGATSSAFNVGRTQQTITFAAPASPVSYGVSPIMLSATASSGLPVTFSILSGPATVSGNTLTITGVGLIVVAANQSGNADYFPAPQVAQTIVVNKGTLSLTLGVAPASPVYGTLVTFTGSPAPAGSTSTEFSFLIDKGTANLGILPATILTNNTVTATYGQLKAGAHTVELDFSGTANYAATASPSVAVNVTQATPAITWSPASSIPYGTSAASLLNVTANTPGTFTYTAQKAGGSAVSLTATTILAAGSYTLTASFAPNDSVDYKSATQMASLSVTQKTLTVTANNATRVDGTANPSFTGTVTGAVNGDVFTETFTTTATTTSNAGNYAIVPSVTGADLADYTLVVDNGALTVTQAASATAITSSTVNANLNASVTFTATITSSTTGTPTGSVQFLNGSTVLGSVPLNNQGVATYMTSALPAGTDAINAVYAGNQNFTGSMATLMQQVTAPNFSLKSSATQLSLIGGDTGRLTITLTPVGGYTGMTSFSCAGLPQNETCGFNPPTLTADGSNSPATTTMTITTDGPGSGTVGLLRPQSPGTPALLASLAGLPACFAGLILFWQRKRLSPPVRRLFWAALLIGGLAGSVAISACGGSSQLKTPPGTSTISVMATGSGNSSQSIMITLTVTQ